MRRPANPANSSTSPNSAAGPSVEAAHRAPRGELRRYPYGHFDIYRDPKAKADQLEFLARIVGDRAA